MRHASIAILALAAVLAGAGCSKSRPTSEGGAGPTVTVPGGGANGGDVSVSVSECTKCHGDAARAQSITDADGLAIAPPRDASGLAAGGTKIGAHQAHLRGSNGTSPTLRARAIACASCHVVPTSVASHVAGVRFRGLAIAAWTGAAPAPTYGASGCAATYCHGAFPNGANRAMTWNGTAADAACGTCHGLPPGGTHPPLGNGAACSGCHAGYTGTVGGAPNTFGVNAAVHLDGNLDVAGGHPAGWVDVNLANRGGPHAIAYNEGGAQACTLCHGATLTGDSGPSCLVCHDGASHPVPIGNTNSVGPIVAFDPAGNPNCTACHGTTGAATNDAAGTNTRPAPPLSTKRTTARPDSGSHAKHGVPASGSSTMAPLTSLTCNQCHATPTQWQHADAAVTFTWGSIATNVGAVTPVFTQGSNSCAASYCHGNFRNGATGNAPVWGAGSSAAACGTCHALPPAGSHPTSGAEKCSTCHGAGYEKLTASTGTVVAASHVDGNIDVLGSTCTFAAGCTPTDCTACHGDPPAGNATLAGSGSFHPQRSDCGTCHPGATAPGAGQSPGSGHMNGVVDLVTVSCTLCHGTAGRANGNMPSVTYDANQAAAPPVDAHNNATGVVVGVHLAHVNPAAATGVYKPVACSECHAVPGTNLHANGSIGITFAGATGANQAGFTPGFVQGNGTSTATTCTTYCHGATLVGPYAGSVGTWAWNGAPADCGSCHADPPATPGHTGAVPPVTPATNCGLCHPGYGVGTVNVAKHINGQLDGGEGGNDCAGCHGTIWSGMNGTAAKTTRHAIGNVAGTNDSTTDSGISWGNPLSGNAAASRSCVNMCHGDHPHDLTSPATVTHENNAYADAGTSASRANGSATRVGSGGSGTQNRARTDFDATLANGGLCVSCHLNPVNASHPPIGKAAFDAAAHDFTAVTVAGTGYDWRYALHAGDFLRNCTKCHASNAEGNTPTVTADGSATVAVHFSDNASLLSGTSRPAGTPAGFVCYNCHGSAASPASGAQGNRSGKDIQSQIVHATASGQSGHPADSDTVHDSVAEQTAAVFGNALGVAAGAGQRHAACLDCHDPHEAKPTASTPPYTTGTVAIPTTLVACPATIGSGTKCATATGTGTTWTAAHVGWKIQAGGSWYTVVAFTSATSLTLYPAPSAAVAAGSAYTLQSFYRATNTAGPALQGAWGARFGGALAALTAPTAANFTKATVVAGTEPEATVCLKCHSAYYWGASAPPATPVGTTYTTGTATASNGGTAVTGSGTTWTAAMVGKAIRNNTLGVWHYVTAVGSATSITISPAATAAWSGAYTIASMATDVARELNPANVSFHPVLGTNSATLGNTGNILPPYTRSTLMTCTDCHESDVGTDPNGPHGSAARFILKGPNTTWDPSVTNSSSGMPSGTFCANCHRADFQGGRYTAHTNGRHNIACMSCHVAIPHGSGHAGLLVSLPGGAGGNVATDSSPYVGAQVRLGIFSYPATNTSAWNNPNCGCDSVANGH